MTETESTPLPFSYDGYHHVTLWVGNALQASSMFCIRFGFEPVLYRGLETGHKDVASHVVRHKGIFLVFESPLSNEVMSNHIAKHGDGVRDFAITVSDCAAAFKWAQEHGEAEVIHSPETISDDSGRVVVARIKAFADTTITFVENRQYSGIFLPNYFPPRKVDPLLASLYDCDRLIAFHSPSVCYEKIDHLVGCHPCGMAEAMATKYLLLFIGRYKKILGLSKFASFDESQIHSEVTALRSIVMADHTPFSPETIKILATEPVQVVGRSQIQEFMDFYRGEGIQHMALLTSDILLTIASLHARGVEFLKCPPKTYYDRLRKVLADNCENEKHPQIEEDIDMLEKLHILLDYDENGYLLQILSRPLQDRPTMFIEVIERHSHNGFGEGNFKALFQAIEQDQAARGTLFTVS